MIRMLVFLLLLQMWPAIGAAQTGVIVSYEVQFYLPGVVATAVTGSPFTTLTIPVSAVTCNQPSVSVPAAPVLNPKRIWWDDLANAGRTCMADASAFLMALPIIAGSYTATLIATSDFGEMSARSAASNPFGRSAPLAAPTGLKVLP